MKHQASISELKRNFMECTPEPQPSQWEKRLTASPATSLRLRAQAVCDLHLPLPLPSEVAVVPTWWWAVCVAVGIFPLHYSHCFWFLFSLTSLKHHWCRRVVCLFGFINITHNSWLSLRSQPQTSSCRISAAWLLFSCARCWSRMFFSFPVNPPITARLAFPARCATDAWHDL